MASRQFLTDTTTTDLGPDLAVDFGPFPIAFRRPVLGRAF
ncbi:hypothetical protein I545_0343 [Mycobacterium kansasii 662]|uniref:Uncharacterized protein n=2 Tax=Mycobacterium kansasii TaxID=1768 RepID=A0A1V3WKL1_MYCKA|nr:hypothetical protein I547_1055 [Mycobacterium kansasii 824]EUA21118.1 hypothetical protein I545_0343 [Mycobacterium kansasii 662]OOK67507.1 hypothetical protein BZL30_7479 [Mycobacterium kansasii]OOK83268.1 hypothetical protein BZL29_0365 [Mycobacterium kansasii]